MLGGCNQDNKKICLHTSPPPHTIKMSSTRNLYKYAHEKSTYIRNYGHINIHT